MIIVISKIQVRRGSETELPGTPISTVPPVFNPGLDAGELAFTTDSGRVFIGPDSTVGNPNFQRTVFPYQNIEVLTENSPRNQQLFNQFVRNPDRNSFFLPTLVSGSTPTPLNYTEYDGAMPIPTQFFGQTISATVDYHAFDVTGNPVQQGTVRIMCNQTTQKVIDTNIQMTSSVPANTGQLNFSLSPFDTTHGFYNLLVSNSGSDVYVIIRVTTIRGFTGPY